MTAEDGKGRAVWLADLTETRPIHKLTFEGLNQNALWTRDGRRVVFFSDRDGGPALFWQRVDGGPAELLTRDEQGMTPQAECWSPDGKQLIFTNRIGGTGSAGAGGISIVSVGADRKPILVVGRPATNATLSPDGRWIAYHSSENGRNGVYVQPFPITGEKHEITPIGVSPLWSPDGRQLFFLTWGNATGQIMAVDIDTQRGFAFGKPAPLPIEGVINNGARPYDISPDGKRFVVLVPKALAGSTNAAPEQINVTLNWLEELKQRVPRN